MVERKYAMKKVASEAQTMGEWMTMVGEGKGNSRSHPLAPDFWKIVDAQKLASGVIARNEAIHVPPTIT